MKTVSSTMVVLAVLLTVLLAGCSRDAPQMQEVPLPAPTPAADLVIELASNPERLKEVRRLCREDREQVSEELCIASAMATRQRFMGDGKAKYTPEPVGLPDARLPEAKDE
ncbi:entry exclusion lipoprotein TrbK [Luteimonas saliphila]|uniref:entry exclusion lipoprotein TrbK n=1 Tax=Luteimonas saliphila TaxID=2804919 RepID=UPI001EE31731|nr:entry exclusion lipoprotein TrbK [Luteimonas saliphila]